MKGSVILVNFLNDASSHCTTFFGFHWGTAMTGRIVKNFDKCHAQDIACGLPMLGILAMGMYGIYTLWL